MFKITDNKTNKEIKLNDLTENLLLNSDMLEIKTNYNELYVYANIYPTGDFITKRYIYILKDKYELHGIKEVYLSFDELQKRIIDLNNGLKIKFNEIKGS